MNLNLDFFTLRSIFYLLKPSETYFDKVENVPDFTSRAFNVFFSFIIIEQIILVYRKRKIMFRLNDTISSLSAGMISIFPNFYFRKLHLVTYIWCFDKFNIYSLKYDSFWTYLVTFLLVDMAYYWLHRAAHEVNLFWAAHQTHHSSEEYNITTALRQSIFQAYGGWIFYLPLSLFIPPSIFLVHVHLNVIYQFWIHTEIVDNLGFLELILNTPSHHRVHHGRNPYCIDKNYAGVLIIWDKLFGTFEAEKDDEQLAYGLVHPLKTWDPIHAQIFNYKYIFKKFRKCATWSERFGVLFKGPGWLMGTPRLGIRENLPKIKYPIKKYNVEVETWKNWYIGLHFVFTLMIFTILPKIRQNKEPFLITLNICYTLLCLTCYGKLLYNKKSAINYEMFRLMINVLVCILNAPLIQIFMFQSNILFYIFTALNTLSFLAFFIIVLITYSKV
ncbi:unnamed protein product [Brachionus calyciflorus]|uniref:Fatty acid hydroxylase domain-containing protein n=1 Tax=Brachionus calyciflorus TaxID=104777 RepID=A0A813QPH6_9BILA|nr:unnamed protein product [Brachionus calyciflorus]